MKVYEGSPLKLNMPLISGLGNGVLWPELPILGGVGRNLMQTYSR